MKQIKLSSGNHAEIPDNNHARHRRIAYYHGKYNREITTTLLLLSVLGFILYRIS